MVDARMTEMAEIATARANVYGMFTAVFQAEPSSSFLTRLKDPEILGVFEALGLSLGDDFHDCPGDRLREDLAIEFTRLFLGPGGHISPHESIHIDRGSAKDADLWGQQTVAVKRFMEGAGLAVDDDFSGMPDHISAELEFMRKLCEFEAAAWIREEEDNAVLCQNVQKRFVEEHLIQWVPSFCDKVMDMARMPFFKEMAKATKGFVDYEQANLSSSA
jgi:TorA maturation chaperone TorD